MLVSPVTGLKDIKLRPSEPDLAAGFPLAGWAVLPLWGHCPGSPAGSALPGLGLGWEELFVPSTVGRGGAVSCFSFCASDTFPLAMETIPGMICCCSNRSVWQWSSSFQQQREQSQRDIVLTFPSLWTGVWSQTVLSLAADEAGMAHVNSPFHLS